MSHAYIGGGRQPDEFITAKDRAYSAGQAIGILVAEANFPFLPGNVSNATTFDFPVTYELVRDISWDRMAKGEPGVLDPIVRAGRTLVERGVRAVVGACGSFIHYQTGAAAALSVPTFLSVMLQIPLVLRSLGPTRKLGVIAVARSVITGRVLEESGVDDPSRLVVVGADALPEMGNLMNDTGRLNSRRLEMELAELARDMVRDHPEIGALLLQCSDFPPYAWAVQKATGRAVFDSTTLINWVYNAVVRKPFEGFI